MIYTAVFSIYVFRRTLWHQERAGSEHQSGCLSTCSPGGLSTPLRTSATPTPRPPRRRSSPPILSRISRSCPRYVSELHTLTRRLCSIVPDHAVCCVCSRKDHQTRTVPPGTFLDVIVSKQNIQKNASIVK